MTSRIKTGEGVESQLAVAATGVFQQRKRFDQNYGAMTMVMEYLPRLEQLKMQGLDTWQYNTGVGRVQVRLEWPQMFYFSGLTPQILAVSETGECQQFDCRGEINFTNAEWISCQVGRYRLFQCTNGSLRILKIDPSQRSFTVERQWARPEREGIYSLTNFKDRFIFLIGYGIQHRYSLNEDRLEVLPPQLKFLPVLACSLGDKVYVFANDFIKNSIQVLHNPGASISSQELRWQAIEVPKDIFTLRSANAFVPLNSTEIAILGGEDQDDNYFGAIVTFSTSTCEFKKELEDETFLFRSHLNQSVNVCENTIIALVIDQMDQTPRLIKYTKGDTCVTRLKSDFQE